MGGESENFVILRYAKTENTDDGQKALGGKNWVSKIERSYLGRVQTASALQWQSLSIVGKALLPRAGIVHRAQSAKNKRGG